MFKSKLSNRRATITAALAVLFAFALFGCGFGTPTSLQQEIRKFFYENQTDAGEKFVGWAEKNLQDYPARRIYSALYTEGEYHADLGHPNAISVISFAARSWANEKGILYEEQEWRQLQQKALENIRSEPGELQLWPED